MRINGIGITFLGVSKQDENGIATATAWFTFVYLPIFPISRSRVRFLPHQGSGFSYELISGEKFVFKEILKTYFFGWILYPLIIAFPAIFAFKEVWQYLGLPESIHIAYIIFTVIWAICCGWKLMDKQEEKCRLKKK